MVQDPIVNEVRRSGEKLAEKAGHNVHTFFENLRKSQKGYADRVVDKVPSRPLVDRDHA
jgi:hypothetical protein